jgi:hypothetical protein
VNGRYWPHCTVRGCDHDGPIPPGARLTDEHLAWVSANGHAVCTCHPPATAHKRGVVAFTGKTCRHD